MSVITGQGIVWFRYRTLLKGMQLEAKGLKLSRGASCLSIIKKEFGLKGSRASVIEQFEAIMNSMEVN